MSGAPSTDLPAEQPEAILVLPGGETALLSGRGLLGRAPRAEPVEYVDALIRLRDVGRSVSKTHLEWGFDQGGFYVLDRWSANGTVIVTPDGEERRCEPGLRMRVPSGSTLRLGVLELLVSLD